MSLERLHYGHRVRPSARRSKGWLVDACLVRGPELIALPYVAIAVDVAVGHVDARVVPRPVGLQQVARVLVGNGDADGVVLSIVGSHGVIVGIALDGDTSDRVVVGGVRNQRVVVTVTQQEDPDVGAVGGAVDDAVVDGILNRDGVPERFGNHRVAGIDVDDIGGGGVVQHDVEYEVGDRAAHNRHTRCSVDEYTHP